MADTLNGVKDERVVRYSGALTDNEFSALLDLVSAQQKKGTTRHISPFVRDEILIPVVTAIQKRTGGDWSKLDMRISELISEKLS